MVSWMVAVLGMSFSSIINVNSYATSGSLLSQYRARLHRTDALPRDISFDAGQVEIIRMIGKIDVQIDRQIIEDAKRELERSGNNEKKMNEFNQWTGALSNTGTATSVRVFEARIPGGTKCFLKEFLPIGLSFGRRELLTTRKLVARWNELETQQLERCGGNAIGYDHCSQQRKRHIR